LRGETFVVSSSTSEERTSRGSYTNTNNGGRQEYKSRGYNKDFKSGTGADKKDYRNNNGEKREYRGQNQNNTERKDFKKRDGSDRPNYNNDRPNYNNDRPNYNNDRPNYNNDRPSYNNNRSNNNNNRYNKDDDYSQSRNSRSGNNHGKDFRSRNNDSKGGMASQKDTKVREQQPDKVDIVKRLEKEKKVMQKKNDANNKKAKAANARPQVKVKRTNNIDWTKEYENDSFDDDDMFYTFK
jgi:hypothetical protein